MSDPLQGERRRKLFLLLPWQVRYLINSSTDELGEAAMRALQRFPLSDEQKTLIYRTFSDSLVMAETARQFSSRLQTTMSVPVNLADDIAREFEQRVLAELPSLTRSMLLNMQRDEVMEGRELDMRDYEEEENSSDEAKGKQTLQDYMRRLGVDLP